VLAAWRGAAAEVRRLGALRAAVADALLKRPHLPRRPTPQASSGEGQGGELRDEEVWASADTLQSLIKQT
jgi:hypothetical protein